MHIWFHHKLYKMLRDSRLRTTCDQPPATSKALKGLGMAPWAQGSLVASVVPRCSRICCCWMSRRTTWTCTQWPGWKSFWRTGRRPWSSSPTIGALADGGWILDIGWLLMVVDGCWWLWMVVDGCLWLLMVVGGLTYLIELAPGSCLCLCMSTMIFPSGVI